MNKETSTLNHKNAFNRKAFGLTQLCDALRNLVPFVKFKKREKHPWRSVTFSFNLPATFLKGNNPPWAFFTVLELIATFLHGCFQEL